VTEQIPLARPELGPREEELLLEVVRSGSLSLGPKLGQFERDFGRRARASSPRSPRAFTR